MHNNIKWPALLILENDDLLYYLESAETLSSELDNHYLKHSNVCILLDKTGQQFNLTLAKTDKHSRPYNLSSPTNLELTAFNQMVRNHLSARQQCCVLKITIDSFDQGFQLVLDTAED